MKAEQTPHMKDIASMANVSPSTVSMVLNNRGDEFRIAPATQQRILAIAKELGVSAGRHGKGKPAKHDSRLWSIFSPNNFDRGPTAQFFRGVNRYLRENLLAYEAVIFPFERGHLSDKAEWLSSHSFSGAFLTALNDDDLEFIQRSNFDIPLVLFNRTLPNRYSVSTDEYATGQHAMEHFLSHGRTRFALIAPSYSSRSMSLRIVGFQDKFYSQQSTKSGSVVLPIQAAEDNAQGGFAAMQAILSGAIVPDAVFVLQNNMVSGVVNALRQKGLAIPEQVEIITNGDAPINALLNPSITSFDVPTERMSHDCAMLLHTAIRNHILCDNVNRTYDAELVCRQSSPK